MESEVITVDLGFMAVEVAFAVVHSIVHDAFQLMLVCIEHYTTSTEMGNVLLSIMQVAESEVKERKN